MVDRRRAGDLADEDEEDRVADPEARRDEGYRDDVEGDEGAAEIKGRRDGGGQADGAERAGDRGPRERDEERETEEDHRGRHRAAEPGAQPAVERGEDRNADPGQEHDRGDAGRMAAGHRGRSDEHTSELQSLMRHSY